MSPTRLAVAFALAVCFASAAGVRRAPAASPATRQAKEFAQAKGTPAGFPTAFEFELNGFSYRVAANGNGRRTKGDRTRRFNLRLDSGDLIEALRFALYEGDLLLFCGINHGDGGSGLVIRLEQPSMRALWRGHIPAFNVGEPLREGRSLYVTGIGFVGKMDLRTGEFDWQHDDLYDTREGAPKSFNSFETPELAGDAVLFRDAAVYNQRRTLVVNKKTGKIIRVE